MEEAPYVTIVLPCYNEQDHVIDEVERICKAMDASGYTYELLAVDDCSTDETLARLQEAAPRFPNMRVGAVPPQRRVGHRAPHRHPGGPGRDRRLDRRRHDLPERAHPRAGPDPGEGPDRSTRSSARAPARRARTSCCGCRPSGSSARWPSGSPGRRSPTSTPGCARSARSVAKPYLRLLPPGFSCVTTITLAFLSNQHDVYYVPIDYAKRAGKSKFSFVSDAYRYILQVLRMVMYFNPLKVLMPPALWLVGDRARQGRSTTWSAPVLLRRPTPS